MVNKHKLIGLSQRNEKDPSLIKRARLRFFSIILPKMKPNISGGIGQLSVRRTSDMIATIAIKYISNELKEIKYTPVTEKNNTKGTRIFFGIAKIRAI